MARHRFGGVADYAITAGTDNVATLQPGVTVTCWNAATGGTQYTDLTQTDGTTAITDGELTTDSTGAVPEFFGPDTITELYLDANGGSGPRRRTLATDLGSTIATVDTDLTAHTEAANPHGTQLSDLADVYDPSITAFTATTPFTIAHRGSGGEFPEHTLRAYEAALAAGAEAIEVSVHTTSDGVPVCFHDTTLDRMTNATGAIADWTYAQLREQVKVKGQDLLGAGWSDQDIPTLEEVMNALYGRCVIFLEAKSNPSVPIVQDYLTTKYPGAQRSVVWKGFFQHTSHTWAKAQGFTTWGYVNATSTDAELGAVDDDIDMWGVPHTTTDARISEIVARGKPVIVWEVHRHVDTERFTGLGVQGLMCSQWIYLNSEPELTTGNFSARISPPGTIGLERYEEAFALKYDATGRAYLDDLPNTGVLMGGMRAPDTGTYTISFELVWDDLGADGNLHSDVAFAREKDDPWEFFNANDAYGALASPGGYHALVRRDGRIQLYSHVKGSTSGTQLATLATVAPVAGVPMSFEIEVTPGTIYFRRTDTGPYEISSTSTTYRGRYWHLSVGSIINDAERPYWPSATVT